VPKGTLGGADAELVQKDRKDCLMFGSGVITLKKWVVTMPQQKKKKELTPQDIMKYEIAEELGLTDKIKETGWKSLTAKESGRIGGLMTKRQREKKATKEV